MVHNENGTKRVVVTKDLPGTRWIDILTAANIRVEVCAHEDFILSQNTIKTLISDGCRQCHGVIGQLTEDWDESLFEELRSAGGNIYSNYAVGYNNVDVKAATKAGIPVGNTPGVLTETTAELAVSLTFAAARRVVEADRFMRKGLYLGWAPTLMVGQLLQHKTVGIVGAGRIGTAYARMMAEGHKCNIVYFDPYPNKFLEQYIADYSALLESKGEAPVTCRKIDSVEELLQTADVVSLHCSLDENTYHLLNEDRLNMMKKDAVLVNCARGPVIDEVALTNFLQANENFRCGLDVYEDEPNMTPGLSDCENVVIVPHIASASLWTRSGMATLAAANVAMRLQNKPVWNKPDILGFVEGPLEEMPQASPSIVNAEQLGLDIM
ncbi:hydroxypyruvate reductase [Coccomyxa subellipsoidea C-169]|uniref:Hydroxypyruvate reductase n=1 Tax=Coccomyxa subellipsoidea (strain C-169) TaxID=574566 RepID=I0Z0L5_COCSC|nr:hydroxypyruvate reductase [Coccomyxa subellipsoidea C-169]EIE24184.1 hydroxypyruvate reductase [Coccomyxa subellipsoidea C-169]|eukprot:XP_005648728.1 hydroxypyruvate reductase [Coccomyxa subellipsoidea C-169]